MKVAAFCAAAVRNVPVTKIGYKLRLFPLAPRPSEPPLQIMTKPLGRLR